MEAQPSPQPTPPLLSQQPHYPDSLDSSPRSRNTDSWDEPYPHPSATKLRLMVSYGGHISPRPHDKTLCYIGGDTRIVVVDRHTSLSELSTRFSKTFLNGLSFALKYQLPDEDLDSLISVTTDEDFENMVEEFDQRSCNSSLSKPSRIRLFLFPAKPGSSGPVSVFDGPGSGLGSGKSEDWLMGSGFLDGGLSDTASVNCLIGLDDVVGASRNGSTNFESSLEEAVVQVASGQNLKPGHDVQSVPDSPIRETNSSFGSTSSSVANLASIKVSVENGGNTGGVVRGQDQKVEGIEESFAKLGVGQKQDEEIVVLASPVNISPVPVNSAPVAAGDQNRALSDDERSDHGVSQTQALTPQFQQKSTAVVDLPSPNSVSSDSITNAMSRPKSVNATNEDLDQVQIQSGASRVAITSGDPNHTVSDTHSLVQMQQNVLDPGYVLQHPFGQQQQQSLQHQFDQQHQQALQRQFDQQQQQALQHQFDQQQQQRQQQQALQHQFDQQQQQQASQHQFDQQQQQASQHQYDQQQQQASQRQFDQQQQQALQQQFDQQQQQALQQQFDQQQRQQKLTLQHQFDQQQHQQALQHQFDQQQQQKALQHQFDQQQQQALEQQFDQQQQHHQQQTLQHQFDKQQQQEAPQQQQIIHGTHFIQQTPAGPVSIPAYYPVYPSQQQLHPQHHYQLDQQYPVYYLPARQSQTYNLSMQQQANHGESATTITSSQPQIPPNMASVVPSSAAYIPTGNAPLPNSEVTTASAYRKLAAGTPQLVQVPSNQHQQQYVAYSQVQLSQSIAPNSAAPPNYAYNYADPAHAQIFYAQNLAPTKPSQSRP